MKIPRLDRGLRSLLPADEELADLSWILYLASEGTDRLRAGELLDVLLFARLQTDFRERILLPPPQAIVCDGEYRLGQVLYPGNRRYGPFGLRDADWLRHVLVVGMTGAGKSNLALLMLRVLAAARTPFLVFDWKRSYRDALQLAECKKLLVYTVARRPAPFSFNPLIPPPGVAPGEWLMKLVDVLKHAYFVGEGVEYLLRRAIDEVYQSCGMYDAATLDTPTFEHVRLLVIRQHAQGRMALWKASALRVLESLCFRHGLGPVTNTDHSINAEHLLEQPIILELDALANADKIFLVEALILWIYEHRKRQPHRESFQHALIIEEAHHILSERKERTEGAETIMETCLRQIREFGESVITIDQEPSKLSHSIKANAATKISFRLGTGRDAQEMAADHGLDDEERRWLDLLPIGQAIVSITHRIPRAIHVSFPLVPIHKGSTGDSQVAENSRRE